MINKNKYNVNIYESNNNRFNCCNYNNTNI